MQGEGGGNQIRNEFRHSLVTLTNEHLTKYHPQNAVIQMHFDSIYRGTLMPQFII